MAFAKMATFGVVAWIGLLTVPAWGQLTFDGYDCTEDCSGHQAGYDWAEQNSISDTGDCDGNSQSFNEGCQSYVEEQPLPDDEDSAEDDDGEEEQF